MPETILTPAITAYEGKHWWGLLYTPADPAQSIRVAMLVPVERAAHAALDAMPDEDRGRYRVIKAWLNPSGSWTVIL